jgi:GT2 family glycosyltransferase
MSMHQDEIGVVAIGRNEGERLKRCLSSLVGKVSSMVYVDSGSTDDSVPFARSLGVEVVELDMSKPFSMARGRNAGAQRLLELNPDLPFIQFVDGDCEVVGSWIPAARTYLNEHPDTWVVCGRRRERYPENSIYNRLCDIEWNTPVGPAKACGGDAMMRARAFQSVGGFEEALIAGEEPELCIRFRKAGGIIYRLDAEMTLHDANITRFSAWWKRTLRSGYAAANVLQFHKGITSTTDIHFYGLAKSTLTWSVGWLGITLLLTFIHPAGLALGIIIWIAQTLRIAKGVRHRTNSFGSAWLYGIATLIGKWPQLLGILRYRKDLRDGKIITLIEYK